MPYYYLLIVPSFLFSAIFFLVCGKNISAVDSGFLFSPSYPDYYYNGDICRWYITVHPDHIVRLDFFYFELEDNPACLHDYLSVYDVNAEKIIGKYCGSRYPTFLESSGNKVVVIFKSDDKIVRSGFKVQYQPKPSKLKTHRHHHYSLVIISSITLSLPPTATSTPSS